MTKQRLNIAILGTRYSPPHFRGGEEHILHHLNQAFTRRGHNVHVFTPEFKKWRKIDASSTATNVTRLPVNNIRFFYHYQFARQLPRFLAESSFDIVVNTHNPLGMNLPFHPHVVIINTTCLGEADAVKGSSVKKLLERIMRRTLAFRVEKEVVRNADHTICANNHIYQDVITHFGARKDRLSLIGNGVDCQRFQPDPTKDSDLSQLFNVLYVGRLVDRKNVKLLVQAAVHLKRQSRRFQIHIVGYGEERSNLERLARETDVDDMVTFHGRKAGNELLSMYQSSHAYVLPSRYEGLPLALLEALACGLPSVVGNFAGAEGVITDDFNGFIMKQDCPELCAEYLLKIAGDQKQYNEMCSNARDTAVQRFSWDSIMDQYFEVFEKVIPGFQNTRCQQT